MIVATLLALGLFALYRARRAALAAIAAMPDEPPPTPYTGPVVPMQTRADAELALLGLWHARALGRIALKRVRR